MSSPAVHIHQGIVKHSNGEKLMILSDWNPLHDPVGLPIIIINLLLSIHVHCNRMR